MPVYLFTLHAYRSWMPDHPRGYTKRDKGHCAPDELMNKAYLAKARYDRVFFASDFQRLLIDELITSQASINVRLHGASTEFTHIHFLVSWQHDRIWESVRKSLRYSMTLRIHRESKSDLPVFSDGGSRRHVQKRDHFNYLLTEYLPSHRGVQWYEDRGWVTRERDDRGGAR